MNAAFFIKRVPKIFLPKNARDKVIPVASITIAAGPFPKKP